MVLSSFDKCNELCSIFVYAKQKVYGVQLKKKLV